MRRVLLAFLLTLLILPLTASASILCVPSSLAEIRGDAMSITHPNIAGGIGAIAGTFNTYLDCATLNLVYCVQVTVDFCYPAEYVQASNVTDPHVIWILNNYSPAVPGMPSELTTEVRRKAAVQLAIWHFTDGVDISTGGSDPAVFAAANAIIAAAQMAEVPLTPTSIALSPYTVQPAPGEEVTVTATLYDQNGGAMPSFPISWSITNDGTGSGYTDENGQITVTWFESANGNDQLIFTVDYTIPIGLRWTKPGCQDLIQGTLADGRVTATWGPELPVETENSTWGGIKNLYK